MFGDRGLPGETGGAYSAPPGPLASQQGGTEKEGPKSTKGGKRGEGLPPTTNSRIRHWTVQSTVACFALKISCFFEFKNK